MYFGKLPVKHESGRINIVVNNEGCPWLLYKDGAALNGVLTGLYTIRE